MKENQKRQNIALSKEEGLLFLKALSNPPKPNKRLQTAMRRHGKNIKSAKSDYYN